MDEQNLNIGEFAPKPVLNQEADDFKSTSTENANVKFLEFLSADTMVGDLLTLDYREAVVLVHDSLRQKVGGLPLGCFLLATRLKLDLMPLETHEDSALILLRVVGSSTLPNEVETALWRFNAARRAIDSSSHWDAKDKIDPFTLNQLREAGVRCAVLGTFRLIENKLDYGADISNFYSGNGMKIYKPIGEALGKIVSFTKPTGSIHPLAGKRVAIGRVRYCSSRFELSKEYENVEVSIEPTDMLARRTALFGMSRSGKSNTVKTLSSAIFKIRNLDPDKGRVGQLIFDLDGEYANDNQQDEGCLRNVGDSDVVTYGYLEHPHDPDRRLIKVNFFGRLMKSSDWSDLEFVNESLAMLVAGKNIIDDELSEEGAQYIKDFINTNIHPPTEEIWDEDAGERIRYQRNITVYRAILAAANFDPPSEMGIDVDIKGLFGKDLICALDSADEGEFKDAAKTLKEHSVSWDQLFNAIRVLQVFILGKGNKVAEHPKYREFNERYMNKKNKHWADDTLKGLLSILKGPQGVNKIRNIQNRHSTDVKTDYADKIVEEVQNGKLVIVDQSVGSEEEIKATSERIMWKLFNRQKEIFTNPERNENGELIRDENGNILPPPDVVVYAEEAHNLLPARNVELKNIWPRIAKEGSKFRIGLVYSTQEPSSILPNILKNTDNWFVAHLNNQDETRELKKYYDFDMFVDQILNVPDTGFLRMRCLSNPYIVPVQIDKFVAERKLE